jgi:hypothetical protein
MALGALLLEGDNIEFWVVLGCLSDHNALKQHALIRGLQLDVSLAVSWAYLGKVLSLFLFLCSYVLLVFILFCLHLCVVTSIFFKKIQVKKTERYVMPRILFT